MKLSRIVGCAAIVICSTMAAAALSQQQTPQPFAVRPAPLIGVGVPMIGGLPAALLLARRLQRKEEVGP
jgi:hypothetical protein